MFAQQAPVLRRLGHVAGADGWRIGQVGDGAGHS